MKDLRESYKKALRKLRKKSKKLTAFDFSGRIEIDFIGGDQFKIYFVLVEEDDDFLYLWTEHFGHFLWHKEDINSWKYTE